MVSPTGKIHGRIVVNGCVNYWKQIFIDVGEIFRLKIKEICQFTLIFLDVIHNINGDKKRTIKPHAADLNSL